MTRIYHPYEKWEDHKHGFYNNPSPANKPQQISKVSEMFASETLTEHFMSRVTNEWRFSCEHNLTNSSMNRIAYLGQAACCLYAGVPFQVTMEAWGTLPEADRNQADLIAQKILNKWEQSHLTSELCQN